MITGFPLSKFAASLTYRENGKERDEVSSIAGCSDACGKNCMRANPVFKVRGTHNAGRTLDKCTYFIQAVTPSDEQLKDALTRYVCKYGKLKAN